MGECQSACGFGEEDNIEPDRTAIEYNGKRFIISKDIQFDRQTTFAKVEQAARAFCQRNNISLFHVPLVSRIIAYRHQFVFEELWARLQPEQRDEFMEDLNSVNHDLMDCFYYHFVKQRLILGRQPFLPHSISTPKVTKDAMISPKEKQALTRYGQDMLQANKVAVILMCAGSSSRFEGEDKFLYEFQLGPRKTCMLELLLLRLKRNAGGNRQVPIVINCNDFNGGRVQNYLKEKHHFGFNPSKFRFSTTDSLAVFDTQGKYCLGQDMRLIKRPSGTAACAQNLLGVGIGNFLRNQGVEYVCFCGTENLLQNPGDPLFLGIMLCERRKMGAKCVSPIFEGESLLRYYAGQRGVHILGAEEQMGLKNTTILGSLPVAVNSLIFELACLTDLVADYNHSLFLAEKYRVIAKPEKVFNISTNRSEQRACYSFEKDIRDLISCVAEPILFKVAREEQYAPICSKSDKYCLPMALDYFGQRLRRELQIQLS